MSDQAQGAQDLRGLKALVGILGVLIVLGTALVIGVVIQRIYAKPPAASISGPIPGLPGLPADAVLPAGAHIAGIAAAGGLVAVWVTGASGDRLLLLNLQTGALTVALQAGAK